MDPQVIDQQYGQLQQQAQQTAGGISMLAEKLKAAAQSGNQDAREWMLDLREIALAIQAEQNQVTALLQALHAFVAGQGGSPAPLPDEQPPPWRGGPPAQPWSGSPQPAYPPQQQPGSTGGMLGGFMNSGFGRAVAMGAGFGIGDDLINSIFGGFGQRGL